MDVSSLAKVAVDLFLGKTLGGVATNIGTDLYKAARQGLQGFLNYKLAGKAELEQAETNPEALENVISQQAYQSEDFRKELEKLVNQVQEAIKNAPSEQTSYSNVGNVVHQQDQKANSVSGIQGNVAGNVSIDNSSKGGVGDGNNFRS